MIRCELVPLVGERQRALNHLLHMGEINTLLVVAEGKVKEAECLVLSDAIQSNQGNSKIDGANSKLMAAQRYQHFIDVLNEFREADTHFQAKLA